MKNIEIENKTIRIYSDELIVSELIDVENVDEISVHVNTISGTYLIQLKFGKRTQLLLTLARIRPTLGVT